MNFTHIKNKKLNMVDVSQKTISNREAIAQCNIIFSKNSFNKLLKKGSPKGEIFNTAKCAGIIAVKKTSELVDSEKPKNPGFFSKRKSHSVKKPG